MKRIHPLIPAVFALLVVVVPVGAAAQVAMMNFSSSAVTWSPMIANDGMTLTVSGGGVWFQKSFKSGASPRFDTFDAEGNALADGVYKWELSARPARTAGDRGEWENARTNADGSFVRRSTAPQIEPQSGTFRIANGSIVDPNGASEGGGATGGGLGGVGGGGGKGASGTGGPGTNDQVILDDLIVDGSACIGFDCANGEPFGFDTIRIKENNLRIRAVDTSNSASFPTNDWQIVFNETSNGGANKFSIEDIDGGRTPFTIEAGAPSHSLFVEDGGRIGFGTSTPVVELHVKDGNTPTLRLEQDGTSGFTPQTWDVAGNEAGFFIRDASNGSTLPFRIRPNAPTSSIDVQGTTGNVGIGTSSPDSSLQVEGTDGNTQLRIDEVGSTEASRTMLRISNNGPPILTLRDDGATQETWDFRMNTGGDFSINNPGGLGAALTIDEATGDVTATTFNGVSSRELKNIRGPVDTREILAKVVDLPITDWSYKKTAGVRHLGPVAEDFYAAFKVGSSNKSIGVLDASGVALAAIQGLHQEVEAKDQKIADLEQRLAALEDLLTEAGIVE